MYSMMMKSISFLIADRQSTIHPNRTSATNPLFTQVRGCKKPPQSFFHVRCSLLVLMCVSAVLGSVPRPAFVPGLATQDRRVQTCIEVDPSSSSSSSEDNSRLSSEGTYRPFVDYAFRRLEESGLFTPKEVPSELQFNESPAKGLPAGSVVRMETKAMMPTKESCVSYARYALLETLVPSNGTNSTSGIQVMNLVVFPSSDTPLPVWGVDLVSLPGGRHLLAMDSQPMSADYELDKSWQAWHETHVKDNFAWGGDIPEEAADFFSPYVLWTRLKGGENATSLIQSDVWDAFRNHLELYLSMIEGFEGDSSDSNWQERYLEYRLANDPARPMLKSLYGEEWTERVLEEVLFPRQIIL